MNPLCCIAPVSIERDRTSNPVVAPKSSAAAQCQPGLDAASSRNAGYGSKPSFSAQASSVGTESEKASATANHEVEDTVSEPRDSKVFGGGNGGVSGGLAGILYKWVNYGKGWRSRWFVLEDGVLSYYKVHGPDKILVSPAREKELMVIGEDSLRYIRKANWSAYRLRAAAKPCKPIGEVHLKVWLSTIIIILSSVFVHGDCII